MTGAQSYEEYLKKFKESKENETSVTQTQQEENVEGQEVTTDNQSYEDYLKSFKEQQVASPDATDNQAYEAYYNQFKSSTGDTKEASATLALFGSEPKEVEASPMAVVVDFMQRAALSAIGKDPDADDKEDVLSPGWQTAADITGVLGREVALTIASYGVASIGAAAISGISWVGRASRFLPKFVSAGIKGATAGAVKSGLDKLLIDDSENLFDTSLDIAQYGAGDFARGVAESILGRFGYTGVIARLIETAADMSAGTLAALSLEGNLDNATKELINFQSVAIGSVDLLSYYVTRGKAGIPKGSKAYQEIANVKKALDAQSIDGTQALKQLDDIVKKYGIKDIDAKKLAGEYLEDVGTKVQEKLKADTETPKKVKAETEAKDSFVSKKKKEVIETTSEDVLKKATQGEFEGKPAPKTKPAKGGALNTERLEIDDEAVINEVYEVAKKLEEVEGKSYKGFKEIKNEAGIDLEKTAKQFADELGFDMSDLKDLQKTIAVAPTTVTKVRNSIVTLGYTIQDLAKQAKQFKDAGKTIPNEIMLRLRYYIELQTGFMSTLKGVTTDLARTLSAFRISVSGKDVDLSKLDLKDILKTADGLSLSDAVYKDTKGYKDILGMIDTLAEAGSVAEINKTVKKTSAGERFLNTLIEYRQSNLLMNPNTHFRNILSQTVHQLHDSAKDYVAATINLIAKNPEGITYREATKRFAGVIDGIARAFYNPIVSKKDVYGMLHLEKAPSTLDMLQLAAANPKEFEKVYKLTSVGTTRISAEGLDKVGISAENILGKGYQQQPVLNIVGKALDWAGGVQRNVSYGLLQAGDKPFSYAGYFSEVSGQIERLKRLNPKLFENVDEKTLKDAVVKYRKRDMTIDLIKKEANIKKIKRAEIPEYVQKRLKEMDLELDYDDELMKVIKDIDAKGLQKADEMTWKDPINSQLGKAFENFMKQVPVARVFIPFVHTPTKILEFFAHDTGLTKQFWEGLLHGDAVTKQRNAAALTTSALLYGSAAMLYKNGMLTPTARDASERKRMHEAGIQENSIRLNDGTWININTLDPAPAMYLTTTANLLRMIEEASQSDDPEKEKEVSKLAIEAVTMFAQNTLNKTWFTSLRDLVNALSSSKGLEDFSASFARSLTPGYSAINAVHQITDKELMDVYGKVMKGQPVLDTFGKPITQYDYKFGLRIMKETDSPIRLELNKLGMTLSRMSNSIDGVHLSDEDYYNTLKTLNTEIKAEDRLNGLISTPQYQKAPIETKIKVLRQTWAKILDAARSYGRKTKSYKEAYEQKIDKMRQGVYDYPRMHWLKQTDKKYENSMRNLLNKKGE